MKTPWQPDTEFRIVTSPTSVGQDGYRKGEPKWLECPYCGASVLLTPDPDDPGVDDLPHSAQCPQRFVKSEWWHEHFAQT